MTDEENESPETDLIKALNNVNLFEDEETEISVKATHASTTNETLWSGGPEFYSKARKYWSKIPATVNGMLGGLGYISSTDIQGSSAFLRKLHINRRKRALDCGAGIGRVTKYLLLPYFDIVDIVEQDKKFAQKARDYCRTEGSGSRLGHIYNEGLQQFCPQLEIYDIIWSQWVLGHLTDDDLVALFQRFRKGLKEGGYFIIKENITSSMKFEIDEDDSSVTRPLWAYEKALRKSNFQIICTQLQLNFPNDLYPVYMIASRPLLKNVCC